MFVILDFYARQSYTEQISSFGKTSKRPFCALFSPVVFSPGKALALVYIAIRPGDPQTLSKSFNKGVHVFLFNHSRACLLLCTKVRVAPFSIHDFFMIGVFNFFRLVRNELFKSMASLTLNYFLRHRD